MELTVQVWLENKPGALMRVAGILAAKGCNITALNVAPDPWREEFSRMTIVAEVEQRLHVRVVNEMNRLVNVLLAVNITDYDRGARPAQRSPAERAEVAC